MVMAKWWTMNLVVYWKYSFNLLSDWPIWGVGTMYVKENFKWNFWVIKSKSEYKIQHCINLFRVILHVVHICIVWVWARLFGANAHLNDLLRLRCVFSIMWVCECVWKWLVTCIKKFFSGIWLVKFIFFFLIFL